MANTYTQIHIQIVFAVKNRKSMIHADWEESLHKYITGIIRNHGHKVLSINGMPDHIHILIGYHPSQSLSNLVKFIKMDSSKWINKNCGLKNHFSWQSGYGAFSYSKCQVPNVINYILNQKIHHRMHTFGNEYKTLLSKNEIEYDSTYIFKEI